MNSLTSSSNSDNVGEYGHHLTIDELPEHNHVIQTYYQKDVNIKGSSERDLEIIDRPGRQKNSTETTENTGGSDPHHNNMPPYFGVYVWQRTS